MAGASAAEGDRLNAALEGLFVESAELLRVSALPSIALDAVPASGVAIDGEVRDLTGLQVNWRFFSLEEINRGFDLMHKGESIRSVVMY